MNSTREKVLITNGYLFVAGDVVPSDLGALQNNPAVVTVASNFHYYGFVPSMEVLARLLTLSSQELSRFWDNVEPVLKDLTADNRQMDKFVVYQNFPKEVLNMAKAQYWAKQILMYWGFNKERFIEEKQERSVLSEKPNLKVLHLANEDTPYKIYQSLLRNKARWSSPQLESAKFLVTDLKITNFSMSEVAFRENGIQLINYLLDANPTVQVSINDATDVIRLAALRSGSDISLREKVKFKSFSRKERRFLCSLLENSKNLEADFAERANLSKLLLSRLHPGDFRFPRLTAVYDKLYKSQLKSFASQVETGIAAKDSEVLSLLQKRPGDFVRRFHKLYSSFGAETVNYFASAMKHLSTHQLVKFVKYVETINARKQLTYPPKGNWSKLKLAENNKVKLSEDAAASLKAAAGKLVKERLNRLVPDGFKAGDNLNLIKLQTNDQELASYGRGTVFPIPQNTGFIRTASYWENDPRNGVTWFDNGWNFFDSNWKYLGACCWNQASFSGKTRENYWSAQAPKNAGAIFSGDPVNSKELKGRACQMIDLYPDKLRETGVRYAIWNILCYSRVPFSKATGEVLGTLQLGEKPESGKLFEPSRAQMVFPLKGNSLTKYLALIDLETNQLIYLDANLKGTVSNAGSNGAKLSEVMPAFMEYLDSLPSLGDLMALANKGTVPVLYSDKGRDITNGQLAFVFKSENQSNNFKQVDLAKLLE